MRPPATAFHFRLIISRFRQSIWKFKEKSALIFSQNSTEICYQLPQTVLKAQDTVQFIARNGSLNQKYLPLQLQRKKK